MCGYAKATTVDIVASTGGLSKTRGIPSTRVNYSLTISRDLQQSLINGLTYIYSNYCHSSTLLHMMCVSSILVQTIGYNKHSQGTKEYDSIAARPWYTHSIIIA